MAVQVVLAMEVLDSCRRRAVSLVSGQKLASLKGLRYFMFGQTNQTQIAGLFFGSLVRLTQVVTRGHSLSNANGGSSSRDGEHPVVA